MSIILVFSKFTYKRSKSFNFLSLYELNSSLIYSPKIPRNVFEVER